MRKIIFVVFFFFFVGCDGKIYQNIHNKSIVGATVQSLEIVASDERSLAFLKKIMEQKRFVLGKSEYKLRVEYRDYALSCTNPLSKTSSDYTYEGLLVLELFYKGNKAYSIYRDIKKDVSEKHYLTLVEMMLEELQIKN